MNKDVADLNAAVEIAKFGEASAKKKLAKETELRVLREQTAFRMVSNLSSMLASKGVTVDGKYASLTSWEDFETFHGDMV